MTTYTIEQVAAMWHCKPSVIKGMIERGDLKARRDGLISDHALRVTIKRGQEITRRHFELRRGGIPPKQAYEQAEREYWQKRTARR